MTSTMSGTEISLRSLRDRPFELLKELEKRSRSVAAASAPDTAAGQEWVGVAFRMGGETFLVAREETREVLGYPAAVTRIPGAKSWVKGLGERARPAPADGGSAAIFGKWRHYRPGAIRAWSWSTIGRFRRGLMVDEVLGFRRFAETEFNVEPPPTVIRCDSVSGRARFRRGGEVWPVLSLKNFGGESRVFYRRPVDPPPEAPQ